MELLGPSGPQHTGPFRTVAVLGEGGMGRVLLGVAPDGRLVAVKQVHADLAEDEGFRARFRREVAASRKVSGAYTAPVLDADPDAPTPWLASAFVPGPSLSHALGAAGVLPVESVRQLAAGLARALADVHRAGLIHRDLKPSNVLLAEDGVRVIDFGIARAAEGQTKLTHTGAVLGSPPFMSPEQVYGRPLSAASDMFSLGATLTVACTGTPPFHGASVPGVLYKVAHEEPDLSAVPPELYELIAPCLAKDEADRPSPQELLSRVGTVTPTARPWPEAVHRLTAEQRAGVERAVGSAAPPAGTVPTPAPAASPPRPAVPPAAAPPSAPPAAPPAVPTPVVPPGAKPGSPRRGRTAWLAAAAAVVAVVAVTAALVLPDDGGGKEPAASGTEPRPDKSTPTPGTTPLAKVRDKYTRSLPACEPAHTSDTSGAPDITHMPPEFGAPAGEGVSEQDGFTETGAKGPKYLESFCVWNSRSGDRITVTYDLYRTRPGGETGAEQAKSAYEMGNHLDYYERGDIGAGDEAVWRTEPRSDASCVLVVRDVNVLTLVSVQGSSHPRGKCEDLSTSVAKDALRAVPE
ncbi:serine/threonine protein kinase [Streptomyces armeniacus]|uniref:Serine/threonine protein kinase n=1 Tax=Streptomyces armeniacus TaxID=83291 RepID=A0A345XSL9_9ACTN|nr:serine/threonine-protein kinase [Streptomyces armeniacus]AXK34635.1 serine/threonine protein kinase [Streptomyces armeniacus]